MPMLLLAVLAQLSATESQRCPGRTTPEINACIAEKLSAARAELDRYLHAARQRLERDTPKLLGDFDAAQRAWEAYADADCGALYAYWRDGTIRTVMGLNCRIGLTRARTHAVWRHWLTFVNNSPPILPEPPRE